MKHLLSATLLAAVAAAALPAPAAAQSDILMRLRSGSPAGDRFRVDSAGGMVLITKLGLGIIPATGPGERMMWHPFRAAFRAGGIGTGNTAWDDPNVGFYSWAGGFNTLATGLYGFAMGDGSQATNTGSVAFGNDVIASGAYATALGERTRAASRGTLAVGSNCSPVASCSSAWAGTSWRAATNTNGSSVAMGQYVTADAQWSFAAGYRASVAGHVGSFVWGGSLDGASAATDSIRATSDGQVTFRNPGGFRIFTNTSATVGVNVNAGGSSWNVISDRNRKENFLSVDPEQVLASVRGLPVTTWQYRDEQDRTVRHIGPMAQDWQAAFGFSADGTTINMSDFDGVNLAAIQALEARTSEQAAQIQALQAENAALQAENAARREQAARQEERLRRLEALAARQTP